MDLAEAGTGPRGYPAQNKTTFVDYETGIRTEILCSSYSDTHFVVITQKEKFGTMVSISHLFFVQVCMRYPLRWS